MGAGVYQIAEKSLEDDAWQAIVDSGEDISVSTYLERILARLDNLENSDGFNVYWIDLFD